MNKKVLNYQNNWTFTLNDLKRSTPNTARLFFAHLSATKGAVEQILQPERNVLSILIPS